MELPHFGRYRTVAKLGAGAAGEVWRAHDEMLARDVAIKTVPRVGRNAQLSLDRFFQEARAVAALSHPGVIRVFDMGEQDGTPYLVMELAPGGSLKDRLADGPMPVAEVCALGIQVAQALAAAHARGIVHRDVKPANVLRDDDGVWRLADFGVAHVPDSTLTLTGQFLGSPAYAAPESMKGGAFGAASDVWGLAATLFEALAGEAPWGDRDYAEILVAIEGAPPRLAQRAPHVPAQVAAAIDSALAKSPADRPTAQAFAASLAGSMSTSGAHAAVGPAATVAVTTPGARPKWQTLAAIGGVAIVVIGLVAALASRGGGGGGDGAPGKAPAARPTEPGATRPTGPTPPSRSTMPMVTPVQVQPQDDKHAKSWRKVQDKLNKNEPHEVCKELGKILDKYDDRAAEQMWAELQCSGEEEDD